MITEETLNQDQSFIDACNKVIERGEIAKSLFILLTREIGLEDPFQWPDFIRKMKETNEEYEQALQDLANFMATRTKALKTANGVS